MYIYAYNYVDMGAHKQTQHISKVWFANACGGKHSREGPGLTGHFVTLANSTKHCYMPPYPLIPSSLRYYPSHPPWVGRSLQPPQQLVSCSGQL